MYVYVGGYTQPDRGGRGEGIYLFAMDETTGALEPRQVARDLANPSFLALHPGGRFLYATNSGEASGISAFALDPSTGELTFLNRASAGGANPAHLSVDPRGTLVVCANYTAGSIALLPIGPDGRVCEPSHVVRHEGPTGPNRARQDGPHAHQIVFDPSGTFVLANDLGLDRTFVYRIDRDAGHFVPNDPPYGAANPGAGPRHLAFHPNGRWVYVINELDSTLTAYTFDERGALNPIATVSTLPTGFAGSNTTAQVVVHPSGRYVYGSNRGHDSIALFTIDQATGHPTPAGHEPTQGRTPRNFNIDPSGAFLYAANQDSDTVVTFRVDAATGRLTPTGQVVPVGSPSCVIFLPS